MAVMMPLISTLLRCSRSSLTAFTVCCGCGQSVNCGSVSYPCLLDGLTVRTLQHYTTCMLRTLLRSQLHVKIDEQVSLSQ